jgi:HD-like signal output (HDOD) protein
MAAPNSSSSSNEPVQRDASRDAFEFVRELATELSESNIELPSFPDVALSVQRVLSDENTNAERVVRVLGAEPVLAARVLAMSNSAALNPSGKAVTELRTAVSRLGFDALRSAAIGFAMAQMKRAPAYRNIERHLNALWQHSVLVASLAFVLARRTARVNADTAMLTGLVHGVGKLYILTHSTRHRALFGDQAMYQRIVSDWHANIAKALLESWSMADEVVSAVHSFQDEERELRGTSAQLADTLELADLLATCKDSVDLMRERLGRCKAATRLSVDADTCRALVEESGVELAALREALGA